MRAILVHGMGRSPASMLVLAARLRLAGIRPKLFSYSVALESWEKCVARLASFPGTRVPTERFVVIGHSLGTVLLRAAIPRMENKPVACFLLAPPTQACAMARRFYRLWIYRLLTGEMGQLLANPQFMAALPVPDLPTNIYAGVGGPCGRYSPFGDQANDGILAVDETRLQGIPLQLIPTVHTLIMNAKCIAMDIQNSFFANKG